MIINDNMLLRLDGYKLGHMRLTKPGVTKIYSYLCARSSKKYPHCVFFGLQPYITMLQTPITDENVEEFLSTYKEIMGYSAPEDIKNKITKLKNLGYMPLHIKAVPEGTVINNQNVLMTVTNTHPDFYWLVGFYESLLLKVWNTISVATLSYKFKQLVTKFTKETSDSNFLLPFLVHDFGYRGVSSEQTSELSGAAHLTSFCGTDTLPALKFVKNNYNATGLTALTVCASEHQCHCSFGSTEQDELDYVNHMIDQNPDDSIVSIVADAYDYWRFLTVTLPKVKHKILSRKGKIVVRGDSGDPKKILCGDPEAKEGSPEYLGTFRILEDIFGAKINSKGYKELNDRIGVIYGDGMYYDRYKDILETMKSMGYANTNLVIGIGGLLLQQHNRDDLGFAFKATYAEINGESVELFKDPITDPGKKSHKGLMKLVKEGDKYVTIDKVCWEEESSGELRTVFLDGKLYNETNLQEIRDRINSTL